MVEGMDSGDSGSGAGMTRVTLFDFGKALPCLHSSWRIGLP